MVKYLTHKEMRSRLKSIKKFDTTAKILGLDIGRKYTGLALTSMDMKAARAYKTVQID
jgi:hypothetical protein